MKVIGSRSSETTIIYFPETVKTSTFMKGMYDVNKEIFCELDDSGRRGRDQKLFKKRFRLDVRKFDFSKSCQ